MSEPQRTIGQLAQLACTWEVLARKAGNVCPGREFPDLTVNDFLKSAAAIAPVLEQAPHQPLGVTILRCIEETRKVVDTNTNLGIVLLLAPLASVPLDTPSYWTEVEKVLAGTTVEDSRNVYAAIRLAKPGGLGEVKEQDVRDEPTLPLRDVMLLAATRDYTAKAFATMGEWFDELYVSHLVERIMENRNIERGIAEMQLELLSWTEDSLIQRKLGTFEAVDVKAVAMEIMKIGGFNTVAGRQLYLNFDAYLRSDNHARNPGTTADLIAAALFVALREKRIPRSMPFAWAAHPFAASE